MPQRPCTHRAVFALSLTCLLALSACGDDADHPETPPPEPVAPAVPDPMLGYQWYLENSGQDVLAGERPVAGIDLNMGALYEDGIRGQGVVVAIVDDGLDVAHEDLAANIDAAGSINFLDCADPADLNTCASGPLLDPGVPDNAHGTGIGGLIGMVAMNGRGGRGIAPEVRLKGFNLLGEAVGDDDDDDDEDDGNLADMLRHHLFAMGDGNLRATDVGIFNMSYGAEDIVMTTEFDSSFFESMERVMASTRGGKGGLYIKAAGNEFLDGDDSFAVDCQQSNAYNVGCFDAATDPLSNLSGIVLTAAVNAAGQRSSYSSEGAPIWIAGFGGEYNVDPAYFYDKNAEGARIQPALFSTDWAGCDVGYHRTDTTPYNAIDNGGASTIDPECNYTASFNGTSAATPTVSGVTALVLQAHPALKARDIHYILAKSARHPGNWKQEGALAQPARRTHLDRILDPGWHVNARNVPFSRWFGYGLVDAQAAVALARTFTPLPEAVLAEAQTSDDASAAIRYAGDKAAPSHESSLAVSLTDDILVERIQIAFDTTHPAPAQLLVTLQSPSGTRIPALLPYTSLINTPDGFEVELLSVNGFLDEPARGEWRLYVEDISQPYGQDTDRDPDSLPQLTSFAIRVLGHAPATR